MDDSDLREVFQSLWADVGASEAAPSFHAMLARARRDAVGVAQPQVESGLHPVPPRRTAWAIGVVGTALAAALAGILLMSREGDADQAFVRLVESYSADASSGARRSRTRSLLAVPGLDLMRSVPDVGVVAPDGLRPARLNPQRPIWEHRP